ncbi:hypothetical protein LWI29_006244 [Acer saccharum]|uniref:Uncharacterized protein n=1 Tax=Acer saccharum TaxID=4024 RepID=A0AA39VFH8_ACESA|nr:hypothetical protein LWI29_006244 [Acer saccharum]
MSTTSKLIENTALLSSSKGIQNHRSNLYGFKSVKFRATSNFPRFKVESFIGKSTSATIKNNNVVLPFIAHVWSMLHHWVGGPPNLYDISGSAHFINKCDNGIVVHRNRDPEAGPMDRVQVCVRKVRNKVAGTIGDAFLSYNRVTGEFMDIN